MVGITFGEYHSYDDLNMILNSKTIDAPAPKTESVDIPGSDGVLDLTEFFGGVNYENRTLTFNFSVVDSPSNFMTAFSTIQNAIHGKKMNIVLDDDANFYYVGRVTVDKWKADKTIGSVTVTADCEPYKYKKTETTVTQAITGTGTVSLTNLRKPVAPRISTDAAITIAWTGGSASLSAGNDQLVEEFILKQGTTEVTVTGTANVTFKYREGGL